jgi:hypothetical protein
MKLFESCAYVIMDEDRLLAADRGSATSFSLIENKRWVSVAKWLGKAKGRQVPFVIASCFTAAGNRRPCGWLAGMSVRRGERPRSRTRVLRMDSRTKAARPAAPPQPLGGGGPARGARAAGLRSPPHRPTVSLKRAGIASRIAHSAPRFRSSYDAAQEQVRW